MPRIRQSPYLHHCLRAVLPVMCLFMAGCQPVIQPVAAPATPVTSVARAMPDYGELADIGERRLFLFCSGEGSPAVLLEAGLGGDHTTWQSVQPKVAQFTRVCSYDRANVGLSDPAPTPRTSADVVADLHALVETVGMSGPIVLVAHSFGALHARLYAQTYPDEVKGLVLVDPVHEDWWTRAAALIPPERATTAELAGLRRYLQSEGGSPEENSEGIDIAASANLVRSTRAPTTLPLIILTAGMPDLLPAGLPDDLRAALAHLLQEELPADLATLSPNSMQLTVPNSGHDIPGSQPTVVAAAIQTLVELDP